MKEYIERNELLKHKRYNSLDRYEIECIVDVDKIIEAPAADVKEVVHAKWTGRVNMLSGDVYYYCSKCGEPNPYEHTSRKWSKFCPKCGSEMILE